MRQRWYIAALAALLMLVGCNFGEEPDESLPTVVPAETSIVQIATTEAAVSTETPLPTATATVSPTVTNTATSTSTASRTVTLTSTATSTPTPLSPPTFTPASTATATITTTPSHTSTASWTPSPTSTNQPPTTSAPPSTFTPPPIFVPSSTFTPTPVVYFTSTPVPTIAPNAEVCAVCGGLRLRDTPGTAGTILSELAASTPLFIIGRTEDNNWVQVTLMDGSGGWVSVGYLAVYVDLNSVAVTGVAENTATTGTVGASNVVSGISSNARTIFLDGLAKGNSAYSFTRVGDSITASPNFLTPIGQGNYNLGEYGYLGTAISFFSGPNGRGANPFAASSIAARNGWSTESVLNPANADRGVCRSGETPLACEYRLVKPSVALIMFGTNDAGGMPSATFQSNLRTIVQTSINMGVIPVLSTIPPKHYNAATDGRIFEFNDIIVATARAYDVPLWDYYTAMAALPSEGLSSDGVHPSSASDGLNAVFDGQHLRYGYPMRNFTALQVLYQLWQYVLYDAGQAVPATAIPGSTEPVVSNGDCSHAPASRLAVGLQGRITPGVPNKVRSAASMTAAQIGNIPGEGVFDVIGGPQCADGYRWWQVNYQGLVGWTASGYDGEYWVEPYP